MTATATVTATTTVTATPASFAPTVLIVEDEWLIADLIVCAVTDAGYRALGPAATVHEALALLATTPCDAALLDINLGPDKSYPLIDRLSALRIPYLLVTGYCPQDLPERYRRSACIGKPPDPARLIAALRTLIAPPPA